LPKGTGPRKPEGVPDDDERDTGDPRWKQLQIDRAPGKATT